MIDTPDDQDDDGTVKEPEMPQAVIDFRWFLTTYCNFVRIDRYNDEIVVATTGQPCYGRVDNGKDLESKIVQKLGPNIRISFEGKGYKVSVPRSVIDSRFI